MSPDDLVGETIISPSSQFQTIPLPIVAPSVIILNELPAAGTVGAVDCPERIIPPTEAPSEVPNVVGNVPVCTVPPAGVFPGLPKTSVVAVAAFKKIPISKICMGRPDPATNSTAVDPEVAVVVRTPISYLALCIFVSYNY